MSTAHERSIEPKAPCTTAERIAKAIPPRRDRLQSRLLVCVAVPALCWIAWAAVPYALLAAESGKEYLSIAAAISAIFGLAAWRLRAATPPAALAGSVICFDITAMSGRPSAASIAQSGLPCLMLLFVLTHLATRYGRTQKLHIADAAEKNGRNAGQVVANLGIAALSATLPYWIFRGVPEVQITGAFFRLQVPMLSALAEATADTVSSEMGQALGGRPFLMPTFKRVPPGTDGAISAVGTLAGIASAAAIAVTAIPTLGLSGPSALVASISATAGLFFDSLLGATAERRGWIGNDIVNFASTAFAAALAWSLLPRPLA